MLNLKKGLALVLAAATAFTFAPVANLGNAVQTEAASSWVGATDITLTTGEKKTYTVGSSDLADGTSVKVSVDKKDVAGLISGKSTDAENTSKTIGDATDAIPSVSENYSFFVIAGKAGVATITVENNTTHKKQSFQVTVKALSTTPTVIFKDGTTEIGRRAVSENGYGNSVSLPKNKNTYKVNVVADDPTHTWAIKTITSTNHDIFEDVTDTSPSASEEVGFAVKDKTGTANLTITATNASGNDVTFNITVESVPNSSKVTVLGKEIAENTHTSDDGFLELTTANPTKKITASIENPQSDKEKLYYRAYSGTPSSLAALDGTVGNNGIRVDKDGNVTATAEGMNNTYYVAVYNYDPDGAVPTEYTSKVGYVKVKVTGADTVFTSVEATVDGTAYAAKASFNTSGSVLKGETLANLTLSTKDKTSAAITGLTSGATVTSDYPSIVAYENGALVAKSVGTSVVTIEKLADIHTTGTAQIILTVTVTSKNANDEIRANDITLTNEAPSAKINPTATYCKSFHYSIVKLDNNTKQYVATSDDNLTLAADGTVTYRKNNATGSALIQITGDENNDATAPKPAVITVNYAPDKNTSNLVVSPKAISLKAGETADIKAVATGASISYTSYAPEIATVDATTGKVTAIKKGTAVISVDAAATATMKAGQELVYVTVDNGALAKPAKVTGVKVTNKKGGFVTVTWNKNENPAVKYYVQKTVNGKKSGKSVNGGKTTLTVKKGATVKVKVKAYIVDADGNKAVGAYSSTVSKKTDKK